MTDNLPGKPKTLASMQTVKGLLERMQGDLVNALPRHIPYLYFFSVAVSAVEQNRALLKCTPASLAGSLLQCATFGLTPNSVLGHAYLVPFYSSKVKQHLCQLIPGYKGLVDLARRSGQISTFQAQAVYKNDTFSYKFGKGEDLTHVPAEGDRGELTYVYAYINYKDGGFQFDVMSKADVDKIRARSKAKDSGPWVSDYAPMAIKTVIRRLSKLAPLSPEFQRAAEMTDIGDHNVINKEILNLPDVPDDDFKTDSIESLSAGSAEEHTEPGEPIEAAAAPAEGSGGGGLFKENDRAG